MSSFCEFFGENVPRVVASAFYNDINLAFSFLIIKRETSPNNEHLHNVSTCVSSQIASMKLENL